MLLNTQFLGKVLLRFEELDSTQTFAQELLKGQPPPAEGTVVIASFQWAGKGFLKNKWESAAGKNLLLSLIVYPGFLPVGRAFLLSQAIGLGLRDWVSRYIEDRTRIKWPNDIYIGNKKIAGVLIQNSLSGAKIQHSVVGIGINVNQTEFPAYLPNPCSLKGETGLDLDLEECLAGLLENLERRYLQLKNGNWQGIAEDYHHYLYGIGERRHFIGPGGKVFEGRIDGVGENGYLLVFADGQLKSFEIKELQFYPVP